MLVAVLTAQGYAIREFLISPTQLDVPNSRLRYYLLVRARAATNQSISATDAAAPVQAKRGRFDDELGEDGPRTLLHTIPGSVRMTSATPTVCTTTTTLRTYLDPAVATADLQVPDALLWRAGEVCDIVTPDSRQSCCFTKAYGHHVEGAGSFLQQAVHESAASVGEEFRQALRLQPRPAGPCPLSRLHLRYFSDAEIARLLGFPATFRFPDDVPRKQRNRLLGNSLSVTVVAELLCFLYRGD
jgi:tRNA (cytosine38-C5)-methyltransferase